MQDVAILSRHCSCIEDSPMVCNDSEATLPVILLEVMFLEILLVAFSYAFSCLSVLVTGFISYISVALTEEDELEGAVET